MIVILSILVNVILVDNYVLSQFLGICSFLGVSNRIKTANGMSMAVIFVMVLSTAVTWPIRTFLLEPNFSYLTTLVFILVIAGLVQLTELVMKRYMTPLYKALGVFLPLITTNCIILAVTLVNFEYSYNFIESIANSVGAGVGYWIAMLIFSGIRERMEGNDIPKGLQGVPITLVAASIVALSFLGFTGLVEGLFG